MTTKMRPLTDEELAIWKQANRLGVARKEGTNITPLDYILTGRLEELKQLIGD